MEEIHAVTNYFEQGEKAAEVMADLEEKLQEIADNLRTEGTTVLIAN